MSDGRAQYPRRRFDRRAQADGSSNLVVQLGRTLAALGRLLLGRPTSRLNRVQLLADYAHIERLLETNDAIHAAQAVVRADSFLDGIMQQTGGQGTSFADRLRSLEGRFDRSLYQAVWDAHKLRNDIAHNHGRTISIGEGRSALQTFRSAASVLGAF